MTDTQKEIGQQRRSDTMGDRICIALRNRGKTTPIFYGHWCGMRGLLAMNEVLRGQNNDMFNVMCNFIVMVMGGAPQPYSYYLYNNEQGYSETADWDNWFWEYDVVTELWYTTHPDYDKEGKGLTMDEVDKIAKENGYQM